MIRAGIYCRVSTEEQAKNGISLQCQQDALTEYATKNGYKIIDYYIDDGFSGTSLKRPELQRLLKDVSEKKLDIVLITKLDRWGRGVKNYYKVDEILSNNKVHWKTILEDYDTTTSAGKLHINIMLSIAENEAAVTSERIKFVFKEKLRRKEPVSALSYGYKKNKEKKMIIDEDKRPIIEDVFKKIVETQSIRSASFYINKKYNLDFADRTIRRWLRNKIYIGIYEGSGIIVENFCEPIITKDLFEKAQSVLDKNVRIHLSNGGKKRDYIFSGLIKCKCCGYNLSAVSHKRSKNSPIDVRRSSYTCSSRKRCMACTNKKQISEKKIEQFLLGNLKHKLKEQKTIIENYQVKKEKEAKPIDSTKIKSQIENLLALYLEGNINKDIYLQKYSSLCNELEMVNKMNTAKKEEKEINFKNIEEFLNSPFEEQYKELTILEKRRFWRSLLKEISFDEKSNLDFCFIDKGFSNN